MNRFFIPQERFDSPHNCAKCRHWTWDPGSAWGQCGEIVKLILESGATYPDGDEVDFATTHATMFCPSFQAKE